MSGEHRVHWSKAAEAFHHYGPPLRPSPEDSRAMHEAVVRWAVRSRHGGLHALLLGVTPEIATLSWPEATLLLAVDQSEAMIRGVWPGDVAGQRQAVQGHWLHLPVMQRAWDVIVGDGSLNCLDYPAGFRTFAARLHDVLNSSGVLILRVFVAPEQPESPEEIISDLLAGRIGSIDTLKFRLYMAIQGAQRSISLHDVWQAWQRTGIDLERVASLTGWRPQATSTLALLAGNKARFSFPTLREIRAVLSEHFQEVATYIPCYEQGTRCPTLVFRPL